METLSQLAYNIRNKMEGGRSTNNSFISIDQIKYNINHYRALFLRRDMRGDEDLHYFEQTLPVSLSRKSKVAMFQQVNNYLISKDYLPKVVRLKNRTPLFITNEAETKTIPVVSQHEAKWLQHSRYTNKDARAYIKDNRLFVTNDAVADLLKQQIINEEPNAELDEKEAVTRIVNRVIVRGVFDFPEEVYLASGYTPVELGGLPYPISADMSQRITEGLVNGSLQLLSQINPDTEADNLPNPRQQ